SAAQIPDERRKPPAAQPPVARQAEILLRHALWRAVYMGRHRGHDHEPLRPPLSRAMKTPPSLKREAWLNDGALRRVFDALEKVGGEVRVAGGAVRNALMGEAVDEIDIATTLTPEQLMKAGEKARIGVHPTGTDHGTITLVVGGKPFEV